jgi:hypothetical protein
MLNSQGVSDQDANPIAIELRRPGSHAGGSPKWAWHGARYPNRSSSIASIVAAIGATFSEAGKDRAIAIGVSITKVGRCGHLQVREISAVLWRTRASISAQFGALD